MLRLGVNDLKNDKELRKKHALLGVHPKNFACSWGYRPAGRKGREGGRAGESTVLITLSGGGKGGGWSRIRSGATWSKKAVAEPDLCLGSLSWRNTHPPLFDSEQSLGEVRGISLLNNFVDEVSVETLVEVVQFPTILALAFLLLPCQDCLSIDPTPCSFSVATSVNFELSRSCVQAFAFMLPHYNSSPLILSTPLMSLAWPWIKLNTDQPGGSDKFFANFGAF